MHSFVLQDWITIRGVSAVPPGQTITQGESDWLDLAPYQDVCFWIDVREFLGTPTLNLQTAPIKEEILFQTMTSLTLTLSPSNPYRVLLSQTPNFPLARYVRWSLVNANSPWDATFRVLVTANGLGM